MDNSYTLSVKGYATHYMASVMTKIEVTVDGGEHWQPARITYQEGKWSWTLWECLLDVHHAKTDIERRGAEHKLTLLCRARDKKGEEQKRDCAWNMRGVAFNAYGKWVWGW